MAENINLQQILINILNTELLNNFLILVSYICFDFFYHF